VTCDPYIPNIDISLPNCQLPDTLDIDQVPAIDTYLVLVWAGLAGQDSVVKLFRKIHIYNEHQAQLELLKDSDLELYNDIKETKLSDSVKELQIINQSLDQTEQEKIEQIKAIGFSNENLIRTKLREYGGDVDKTIQQLVDLV